MAVHAALLSLTQILESLMHFNDNPQNNMIPLINDYEGQQTIKYIHEKMSFLQSFLEDVFHPHNSHETSLMASFEERIRDVAYRAEDVIESHILDHIIIDSSEDELRVGCFKRSIFAVRKAVFRRKLAKRPTEANSNHESIKKENYKQHIQRVMEDIDLIMEEAKVFKRSSGSNEEDADHLRPAATYSFGGGSRAGSSKRLRATKMVGLSDDELFKLKDWLCGQSSRLRIISIVGMGGIGKTTLAQNLFDDPLVAQHFYRRAWSTFSQEYQKRKILLGLANSLMGKTEEDLSLQNEDILEEKVYKSLKGRRYLIVMDDMWNTEAWDNFRSILPDDNNGSRIVLTTRLSDVAAYADNSLSRVHHMQFLDEDQSWDLLREKVLGQESISCSTELEVIGKEIASKCGGLPLAIVLVAGLLSEALNTPHDWKRFAQSVRSAFAGGDKHFSRIMSLSYDHLPHHLKPCFLYLGGFPEDHEIPVFKLLQLWIAEGFIKRPKITTTSSSSCKSLEEVAEEYLDDLVKRNLVLITKKSSTGKSRSCGIHDLLRGFCLQKADDENFFCHASRDLLPKGIENKRRIFTFYRESPQLDAASMNVRSIISSSLGIEETELSSFAAASALVKVFDIETVLVPFSTEILAMKLLHLRYLSFTRFIPQNKNVFPASISRLRNLHTLIVRSHFPFPSLGIQGEVDRELTKIYLPFQMWRMPQLRHLILHDVCFLPSPTIGSRDGGKPLCLQNLHTLSRICNFTFDQECIALIPNLKKLGVIYTEWNSCTNWYQYRLSNLQHLHQLESLDLDFTGVSANPRWNIFPVNFEFPSMLRKLTLRGGLFPWIQMTIIGSLPNLEVLKLREFAFLGDEWVTTDGEFPKLKFLLMDKIAFMHWQTESSHFPCLERLIIHRCFGLEIPSAIGEITTLELIEVGPGCLSSLADSARQIQEEQLEMGNDYLQVHVSQEVFENSSDAEEI